MLSKSIITALALATSVSAQTITTVDAVLKFHVVSSNNLTNNRPLQLRPNEYETEFGYPKNTFSYVGIDSTSPVLHANLTSGVLYSEGKGTISHNGYLNLQQEYPVGNTTQYLFSFANATTYPNATDRDWYIANLGGEGPYGLYHDEPDGIVNGFVLCEADLDLDNGPWYDLTYVTYVQDNATLPGCEFVGIQVASL
jgi:hypothetical protein